MIKPFDSYVYIYKLNTLLSTGCAHRLVNKAEILKNGKTDANCNIERESLPIEKGIIQIKLLTINF